MKRIVTIQDICSIGKCSGTVALPIISAAGVETGIIPTAVLSTHTMFSKYTFCDLTGEIQKISDALLEQAIDFDAVYTGYLGSFEQLSLISDFIDRYKTEKNLVLIDPVMADNGRLYPGFTPEFAAEMTRLVSKADLVIPNLTEASFMLGIPYAESYDEEYVRDVLRRLTALGCPTAAITGISFEADKIGVYYYGARSDKYFYYCNEKLPVSYHGTGDIFASATLGGLMRGLTPEGALTLAVDFTLECMKRTVADKDSRFYGVNFEEALPMYIERINAEC